MDMEQLPYILLEIGLCALFAAFVIATIVSIVLFIRDGIKAKKENRKRNVKGKEREPQEKCSCECVLYSNDVIYRRFSCLCIAGCIRRCYRHGRYVI